MRIGCRHMYIMFTQTTFNPIIVKDTFRIYSLKKQFWFTHNTSISFHHVMTFNLSSSVWRLSYVVQNGDFWLDPCVVADVAHTAVSDIFKALQEETGLPYQVTDSTGTMPLVDLHRVDLITRPSAWRYEDMRQSLRQLWLHNSPGRVSVS